MGGRVGGLREGRERATNLLGVKSSSILDSGKGMAVNPRSVSFGRVERNYTRDGGGEQ